MEQHKTIILDDWLNDNTLCCIKAVSQLNVYPSLQQKNANNDDNDKKIMIIMKIMEYNEK